MIDCVIFDWKRTLYDPDKKTLIDEALRLLEFINSCKIRMILIGKGGNDMLKEVKRLNVKKFFQDIVFAKGEKDPQVFAKYVSGKTWVIGDRVRSEIEMGNRLGLTTIWIKQGKFASEQPENKFQQPIYTVSSLLNCLRLISSF